MEPPVGEQGAPGAGNTARKLNVHSFVKKNKNIDIDTKWVENQQRLLLDRSEVDLNIRA